MISKYQQVLLESSSRYVMVHGGRHYGRTFALRLWLHLRLLTVLKYRYSQLTIGLTKPESPAPSATE